VRTLKDTFEFHDLDVHCEDALKVFEKETKFLRDEETK
jgi:hypothetical protein